MLHAREHVTLQTPGKRSAELANVEGILAKADGRDRVVVTIELLQRSVAVSIDRLDLEPIWP